jgi:hypothetical protein
VLEEDRNRICLEKNVCITEGEGGLWLKDSEYG